MELKFWTSTIQESVETYDLSQEPKLHGSVREVLMLTADWIRT